MTPVEEPAQVGAAAGAPAGARVRGAGRNARGRGADENARRRVRHVRRERDELTADAQPQLSKRRQRRRSAAVDK